MEYIENNMEKIIVGLLLAFFFGVTNKIADSLNEHGLKLFKYADILFGFLWGLISGIMAILFPSLIYLHLALILFWFLVLKLDYINHSLAGVITIILIIRSIEINNVQFQWELFLIIFFSYIIFEYIQRYLRNYNRFFKKKKWIRIRVYLPPFIYSIFINDIFPFFTVISGMIGVELISFITNRGGANLGKRNK